MAVPRTKSHTFRAPPPATVAHGLAQAPVTFTGLPWALGIPLGFSKEAAYIVDAPLYLRKEPGPDD